MMKKLVKPITAVLMAVCRTWKPGLKLGTNNRDVTYIDQKMDYIHKNKNIYNKICVSDVMKREHLKMFY